MRLLRSAKAALLTVALAATTLPIILSATPASACIADGDNDCFRSVQGTVTSSSGLNVRTQPWGSVLDTLPHNYTNRVSCYVQASDGSYWDWIYDSRIGRSAWAYDPLLYTGGDINTQVDEMHEGNCAYFSLSAPSDVNVYADSSHQVTVTWYDQTGGQAQYMVTNGDSNSALLPSGTTSITWNINPGQYMCFAVVAYEGGSWSNWSPYSCLTAPTYAQPSWWFGRPPNSGSDSDPINLVMTADSTVSLSTLFSALSQLPGRSFYDALSNSYIAEPWAQVSAPAVLGDSQNCMNYVQADLGGSWRNQNFSAREGGCALFIVGWASGYDHFRGWSYGGSWYIAASTEQSCLNGGLTHCPISFNQGRDELWSDIQAAARNKGWTLTETTENHYGNSNINGSPYDGNVDVFTLK